MRKDLEGNLCSLYMFFCADGVDLVNDEKN